MIINCRVVLYYSHIAQAPFLQRCIATDANPMRAVNLSALPVFFLQLFANALAFKRRYVIDKQLAF